MPPRTIAIGDIHGCSAALAALITAIECQPTDTVIPLGDYINRGHDSKGVLDQLLDLRSCCNLIAIAGNHEDAMLAALEDEGAYRFFMEMGGITTLDSYGDSGRLDLLPAEHREFLRSCRRYFETATHFFCHANYDPQLPLAQQDDQHLLWLSLTDFVPGPHCSGKIAIVGHTPQRSGILDLGYLKCIDTGCCAGGWLTALDVESGGKVWRVDERGRVRKRRKTER